jgi:hypothetical protein
VQFLHEIRLVNDEMSEMGDQGGEGVRTCMVMMKINESRTDDAKFFV